MTCSMCGGQKAACRSLFSASAMRVSSWGSNVSQQVSRHGSKSYLYPLNRLPSISCLAGLI